MGLIGWNLRYIRTLNACDRKALMSFFDSVVLDLKGGFTKKRYIWNLIRGKGFYKDLSYYVITKVQGVLDGTITLPELAMDNVETIIRAVTLSERKESVRRSFIWQITKSVPILTVDILPYMNPERVANILADKRVVHDDALAPFIKVIIELRDQKEKMEAQLGDIMTVLTEEDV